MVYPNSIISALSQRAEATPKTKTAIGIPILHLPKDPKPKLKQYFKKRERGGTTNKKQRQSEQLVRSASKELRKS
jgi:hypothetical protein